MFKLLKLLALAAVGYFVYEMYLGMTGQPSAMAHGEERPDEDQGPNAWSGTPGRGQAARVEDASGATSTRYVGRGVVRR